MKKLLITILILATILVAQKSYTDDSLLNIDYLKYGVEVITCPVGYTDLHEGSNVYEHNGQLIWMGTAQNSANEYSLHYWICPNPDTDLETWNYKGKIVIKDGSGRELEAEDPYIFFTNNMWYISFENKTEEKEFGLFKISLASYAYNLNDIFWFLGGAYGLAPFGDGFAKDAIYSPCPLNDGNILIFDGKKGIHEENVGIAFWDGTKYVPKPEPIFSTSQIPNAITTGIADNIFKVNDKYIMEIVAYIGNPPNGYWCQGLAISDNLESGWEVLDSEIKNQHGSQTMFHLFYSNGWKALGSTLADSDTIYLAEVMTETIEPEPEPDPIPIIDNAQLVREIKVLMLDIDDKLDEIE